MESDYGSSADLWEDYPVTTLFTQSLEALAGCLDLHVDTMCALPQNLKTKILTIACKRGTLNARTLKSLLHPGIIVLNLSECVVDDEMLQSVAICSKLIKLDLNPGRNQQHNMTKEGLLSLLSNLPLLRVLYIRRCPSVTDDVVETIAKSCPLLTELDIGGCHAVTDASPVALTKALKKLTTLNISESQVGDSGLLELVKGNCGKTLKELHLSRCVNVSDFSIDCIAQNCSLNILVFQGCPVSENSNYALENIYADSNVRLLAWTVY